MAKAAAAARGVETLDLVDAFQGHEICARTTSASTLSRALPASSRSGGASWARAPSRRATSLARVGEIPGGGGAERAKGGGCVSRRTAVGRRRIGQIGLGIPRVRLRSSPRLAHLRPTSRSRRRFRYCVKGSSARVVAVLGRRARVELVATTAKGHRRSGVRPGVRAVRARRAFPRLRRVRAGRGVYRAGPRSRLLVGVRRGRVRYLAVASRRLSAPQAS